MTGNKPFRLQYRKFVEFFLVQSEVLEFATAVVLRVVQLYRFGLFECSVSRESKIFFFTLSMLKQKKLFCIADFQER